jgi:hypothetical protein
MREGCEAFLDGWEQELEKVLTNRDEDDEHTVYKLCTQISQVKICELTNRLVTKSTLLT